MVLNARVGVFTGDAAARAIDDRQPLQARVGVDEQDSAVRVDNIMPADLLALGFNEPALRDDRHTGSLVALLLPGEGDAAVACSIGQGFSIDSSDSPA